MELLLALLLVTVTLHLCQAIPLLSHSAASEASCSLIVSGEYFTSYKITEPGVVTSVDLINEDSSEDCQLRLLVVGGGGYSDHGAGGGSGYLTYTSQQVAPGVSSMTVAVGDYGEQSNVTVDGVTITAQPGQDGYIEGFVIRGGDGYSGGGDYGQYNGGTAGGDGRGNDGGHGTGEDVTGEAFTLQSWQLSPGAGGHYSTSSKGYWGGGGGGVLVDSQGPPRAADTQGAGYGGGASYKDNDGETLGVGLPGVVLVEVGP